ncbi:MAG: ABC transporter substrate-binding protein [Janthinobacterium lividum]
MFAAPDELLADGDRANVLRLNRPFPMLPDALGKATAFLPPMMPQQVAESDPAKPITEMISSGPYRSPADERITGDRVAYERFAQYLPNPSGSVIFTAEPKRAEFDRVEWKATPDAATAGAALQNEEMDWWEMLTPDMLLLLRRSRRIAIAVLDPPGQIPTFRINHLHPPFDNPGVAGPCWARWTSAKR